MGMGQDTFAAQEACIAASYRYVLNKPGCLAITSFFGVQMVTVCVQVRRKHSLSMHAIAWHKRIDVVAWVAKVVQVELLEIEATVHIHSHTAYIQERKHTKTNLGGFNGT